jgi:hypothetical protein
MEHAADAIPKQSSKDLSSNTLSNKDYEPPLRSSKTMDIIDENSPLVKAFKKIMNMRLWDAEGLPPLLAFQDNDPVYAEATSLRIPLPLGKGKEEKGKDKTCVLSPALLSAYKTGCIRTRNYFIAHYCHVNDRVERSEKLVLLAKIPSTAEKTKQQRDRRIKMATSVDAGEIKKLFKIAKIIEEIKLLNSEDHGVVLPVLKKQSSMNHQDFASHLAKCRKKVFSHNQGMKDEIIMSIEDEYVIDNVSNKDDR